MIKLTLPKPPSVNMLYGRNGHRTYITDKGVAWFDTCYFLIKQQYKGPMLKGNISLNIELSVCGRYDYDNCLKALNDLLTKAGLIEDDKYIMHASIEKKLVDHRHQEKVIIELTHENI